MNPISFDEHNVVLGPPQNFSVEESGAASEIGSLPIYRDGEQYISLWKMGLKERLSALLFGKIWLQVLSYPTQPPVLLRAQRTIFERVANGQEEEK